MTWLHRSVHQPISLTPCNSQFIVRSKTTIELGHRMTPLRSHLRFHRCFFVWPSPGGNENTCGETSTVQDWSREADSDGFSGTNWLDAAHANHMACESSAPEACFKKCASQYSCSSSKHFSATSLQRLQQLPVTSDDRAQPQFSRPRAQVLHGCCHWVAHLTMVPVIGAQ